MAGKAALRSLREHEDNLLPSQIIPKAVNGTKMKPVGKLPIMFKPGHHKYVNIYPEVSGVLLSCKASKGLHILPDYYPQPSKITSISSIKTETPSLTTQTKESQNIMREFPSVFDGRIKTMDEEKFHITLAENAKPFCVNTPRAIPYAYLVS